MSRSIKIKPYMNRQLSLFWGTLVGVLFFAAVATFQFIFIYGQVEATKYIVPLSIGALVGWLLTNGFNKFIKIQEQLRHEHETLRVVLDGTEIGVWDWYPKTNAVHFDEQWCHLIGYEHDEIEPTFSSWESRVHPDDLDQVYLDIKAHIQGETRFYSNIHRMQHKDGHWVYILDRGRIIERDEQGEPVRFTGTHTDISHIKEVEKELAESNEKLQALSLQDGLTGLKNRRALDAFMMQQWGHWQRNKTPFSVLMIDIDFFKQFNDFYGHLEGDKCLKAIAKLLHNSIRRSNDIAVRYGGEEFLLVLSDTESSQASTMAEILRISVEALQIQHEASEIAPVVTISIGISSCDAEHGCGSFLEPIDFADQALYLAKKRGRNQVAVAKTSNN